jgi:hypothetical protein
LIAVKILTKRRNKFVSLDAAYEGETFMLYLKEYWHEGFKAGELFIKQCPYTGNTLEARNWRNGWLEGAASALGLGEHPAPAARTEPLHDDGARAHQAACHLAPSAAP